MFHLHKWEELWDLKIEELSYSLKRVYRYCEKCGKWQRELNLWHENFWSNSDTPVGVAELISNKKAKKIIEKINRRKNAQLSED